VIINDQPRNAELIPHDDPTYLRWQRKFSQRRRLNSETADYKTASQVVERDLGKEYQTWERTIVEVIKLFVTEYPNRILKFRNKRGLLSYREIDLIISVRERLSFCEIKSTIKRSKPTQGRNQVKKSHGIAEGKYPLTSPLLIVVDMSYVLDVEYPSSLERFGQPKRPILDSVSEVKGRVEGLPNSPSVNLKDVEVGNLYFDSEEIVYLARENHIFLEKDFTQFLTRFRDAFEQSKLEKERPKISFTTEENDNPNNPFGVLKDLHTKK